MRQYDIADSHTVPSDVDDIIETHFGDVTQDGEDCFEITNPNYGVIESAKVQINEQTIGVDISEISVETAREEGLLSEVREALEAKNAVLRKLTGRTVEDRKEDLRDKVVTLVPDEDS